MTMKRDELLDLIPAYALGALDANDLAAVEAWLPTDVEAQHLLAEYEALTDLLVLAAPAQSAPAHLSADLRQRLGSTRPQPPLQALPKPTLRRNWMLVFIGAAALVVVVAGLWLLLRPAVDPGEALYESLSNRPDVRTIALTPGLQETTRGDLMTTAAGREAVIRVENLPVIGTDQTFQLWLRDTDSVRSGGLFRFDNPQGENYLILPLEKPVTEYVAFGVSLEPAGGSPFPDKASGPRVFRVEIGA
ncbi:MAG TPA: anti-sigma factor [Phototrophicaceae bacterium]|nr:anti-sigma factor [Phototrophicaceae bacterium]